MNTPTKKASAGANGMLAGLKAGHAQAATVSDPEPPESMPANTPPPLRAMWRTCFDIYGSIQGECDPLTANKHRKDYVSAVGTYFDTYLRWQRSESNSGAALGRAGVEKSWATLIDRIREAVGNIGANVATAMKEQGHGTEAQGEAVRLIELEAANVYRILAKPVAYPAKKRSCG